MCGKSNTTGFSSAVPLLLPVHLSSSSGAYGVHTNSFVSWRNPPAGKLSNQYAENREISPSTGNPLLGSELATNIQFSSGGAQLVELALLYKLCPATVGLTAGVKKQRQSKCMQYFNYSKKITYVILTYNTALLPSLLTIFVRVRKEQYHRLFSCYTTATSRAPVLQQWRLNSWTLDFWNHCWWRYPTARRHDNRRIVYYPPQVSPSAMECTRTVLFPGGIRRLVSFRINTLKIEKFHPPLATHCWAVSCKQEFNPAVVGHSL